MDWQEELISIYLTICKIYKQQAVYYMGRLSHYVDLSFSDEEVMTIYIMGILEGKSCVKTIYEHASHHWRSWFPKLPSYVAFVQRINKLSTLFSPIIEALHQDIPLSLRYPQLPRVMDSMPIILAHQGRRFTAKVAPEIATANGYCPTKKLHYYGIKLHVLASYSKGSLPLPEYFGITEAGISDIRVYEDIAPHLPQSTQLFADKAYQTQNNPVADKENHTLLTPVKKAKGQTALDSKDKLLSSAISTVRQPIESFFNWLEQKTHIQIASKVRSYNGLMVHVFGRIAAAFFALHFRFCS